MTLSNDQELALNTLLHWYSQKDKKQFITLGGFAGTGKSTLISIFKNEISKIDRLTKVAFCSYTGRAAQNLKNKLKDNSSLSSKDTISTIHGLIYKPIEDKNQEIVGWDRKEELDHSLIIVDEASMVDAEIWKDLLWYNKPIIAVGDHGQLPPIRGSFNLMENPEIKLTHIHRQAEDNPIIKVSELARNIGEIPVGNYGKKVVKYSLSDSFAQETNRELLENYNAETLILCGYNSTRIKINKFIRGRLGFEDELPARGDRVICLRNNHRKGVYNGMLGTILYISLKEKDWYSVEIEMDDNERGYSGLVYAPQFGAQTAINFTENRKNAGKGDLFDFGYALTVHKAQGSQAKRVVMFEERFKQVDNEMWKRWLYTGVTRAQEELYLFGQ